MIRRQSGVIYDALRSMVGEHFFDHIGIPAALGHGERAEPVPFQPSFRGVTFGNEPV